MNDAIYGGGRDALGTLNAYRRENDLTPFTSEEYHERFAAAVSLVDGSGVADVAELKVGGVDVTQMHFPSLAAFEAADVPDWVTGWTIDVEGATLAYIRDAAGTAVESGNGVKGSPAAEPQALHYGLGAPAIMRMLLDIDRGEFKYPHTLGEDLVFDKPIEFRIGAYLDIEAGATATFRRMIHAAPDEWILRGDGDYTMEATGLGGVNARNVWATWGGVRSSPDNDEDMAPYMTKLCQSVGGTENIINVLHGRYALNTAVGALPRGTWIKGAGERRTVWSLGADGFNAFTTGGELCRFEEMNFELGGDLTWRFDGAYLRINHQGCRIKNVRGGAADLNFDVQGQKCFINGLSGFWGNVPESDSSLLRIGASYCIASNIISPSTTLYAPEALVDIGGGAAGAIYGTRIDLVQTVSPCIAVLLRAEAGIIGDTLLTRLQDGITAEVDMEAMVKLHAKNHSILATKIDTWDANSRHAAAVKAYADGGDIISLDIGMGRASGSTGVGLDLIAEAGRTIDAVHVDITGDIWERETPIRKSGAGTIAKPIIMPPTGPQRLSDMGRQRQITLQPGGLYELPLGADVFSGLVTFASNNVGFGAASFHFRTTNSDSFCEINWSRGTAGTWVRSTANLAVTPGASTYLTVSAPTGRKLQFYNGKDQVVSAIMTLDQAGADISLL